jgi:amino acid adenylation domain-containing protein
MIEQLHEYLSRSADRDPQRRAIVASSEQLSYGQLEAHTNRFARLLQEQGCRDGARVGVLGEKSPWTIAALVATLKAGGVYVPIDSASPAPRVGRILRAAQPAVLLVDGSARELVEDLVGRNELSPDVRIGAIDLPVTGQRFAAAFERADAVAFDASPPLLTRAATEPAHLLFTSGSTGQPKGVVISHANVIAFVEWAVSYFGTRPDDRISAHPPLHFDLSTFDIYATFAAGAELHPVPGGLAVNPRGLAHFIRERELTQWFSVPSLLAFMAKFDAIAPNDFPALRRLLWCGEVLPTPLLAHWMRRVPHARYTNLYGPTEATIASSYHTVARPPVDEKVPIPIGRACAGEELLVLDGEMRPVPGGQIGDLYIGGVGLATGYWRDPERTDAVFVPDPRRPGSGKRLYRTGDLAFADGDGVFHFVGRADSQIKSRGHRIELGEVEAAVNAIHGVGECAVVGLDVGGFEGTAICCAFSARANRTISAVDLRRAVSAALPSYMIPSRWEHLSSLPKNVNGKIDRKAVQERFAAMQRPDGADGAQRTTLHAGQA